MADLKECALGWLDEGMSLKQVAMFTGVSEHQIIAWDRERDEGANPVMKLMHMGMTCEEIGRELGISTDAAHYLVVDTWKQDKERKNAFSYRFPANARAKESTLDQQVAKVREEAVEVYRAYMDMNGDKVLEEAMDVIYATEGILRKYTKNQVETAFEAVKQKAKDRGDIK